MENIGKNTYRVIVKDGVGEIVEKKSRFIATVRRTETEEEVTSFVDEMKKKYWDASHNCTATIIGGSSGFTRTSDDGEPSGTAGRPMLEVLVNENIQNVTVVVTRYFGGTLLGTGGLVRAYTQAVKEGLAACEIGCMKAGVRIKITIDYNIVDKILRLFRENNLAAESSEYLEKASITVIFPIEKKDDLINKITDVTAGKAHMEILEKVNYIDKEETGGYN